MSLFGSLEIGKTGINVAKSGQHTTGHNIANADSPNFSRQRMEQSAFTTRREGLLNGASADGVSRIHDEYTEKQLNAQDNLSRHWKTRGDKLKQLELELVDDKGETLSTRLNAFWQGWENLANAPEDLSVRADLLRRSGELVAGIGERHRSVREARFRISAEIEGAVQTVNEAAQRIAELNGIIQNLEARRANANDFRDERERLLREISQMVDVDFFENEKKHLHVQIGSGYSLVGGLKSYEMGLTGNFEEGGMNGAGLIIGDREVFDLSRSFKTGKIPELLRVRDEDLKGHNDFLDELSATLAFEVNRIHSGAGGLETRRRLDVSAFPFDAEAGELPLANVRDGVLEIHLFNNRDEPLETLRIELEGGVSRPVDLIGKINAAAEKALKENSASSNDPLDSEPWIEARFDEEGRIEIRGSKRASFVFGKDGSGILGEVGLQSFFHVGENAGEFRLNPLVEEDPRQVSAGYGGAPGDNGAALDVLKLRERLLADEGTATLNQAYENMVGELGLKIREAEEKRTFHENALNQYRLIRDSVSGVDLDEELTNMVKYQRAYDASAKYVSTVDQMTETLINM